MPDFADTILPSKKGDVLELNELWSFVGRKADTCRLWVALCRRTRQIVAYTPGDRGEQSARDLRATLPADYRGRATRGDPWAPYADNAANRRARVDVASDGTHWLHGYDDPGQVTSSSRR